MIITKKNLFYCLSIFLNAYLFVCLFFLSPAFAFDVVSAPGVEAEVVASKVAEVAKLTQQIRYLEQALKTLSNAPYQWSMVQNTINELGNALIKPIHLPITPKT